MGECAKLRSATDLILAFVFAVIIGLLSLVRLIVAVVLKGPSRVFCVASRNVRPEVLKDSALGSHEFIRLRTVRMKLHCVVNGPSDKPLMLFLHGFPEFWYSWRHQIKEFSKDYRTVACDMRGYGDSDKPSGISSYRLDVLVEDVDQLITELGYDKCILVAHDWGGVVAWSYAALHPARVERLIIGNIGHPVAFENHLKSAFSQFKKSWYTFLFQVPGLPQLLIRADNFRFLEQTISNKNHGGAKQGTFTPEDIELFKYNFATCDDMSGPINYYRAAMRYQSPQVEQALKRNISMPTLLIWGTNDIFLEKRMAEMSREYVDELTIEYIEGASHWIQQEEPEQFNTLTRQFLKKEF